MENATQKFELGKIIFSIRGESLVAKYFMQEFQPVSYSGTTQAKLNILFVDSLPTLDYSAKTANLAVSETAVKHDTRAFTQLLTVDNGTYSLYIKLHPIKWIKKILPDLIVRLREPSHLDPHQALAKAVLYDAFDYVFQNIQLSEEQSFVHASSVSQRNKALLFAAWGGVGKTTSLLKLMKHKRFEFLSDDLAIVDSSGQLFLNPKKIQVYAYNMIGEPWLKDAVLSGRSSSDLLAWKLRNKKFGVHGVRRRLYAGEIFKEQLVAKHASLSQVFYLERSDVDNFKTITLSAESFAEKTAYVLPHELSPYIEIASFYKSSFPRGKLLFGPDEMIDRARRIVERAATNRTISLLKIPEKAGPEEIYLKILSIVETS